MRQLWLKSKKQKEVHVLDVEMHKLKFRYSIAFIKARRKVWFSFFEAKRQTESYD